MSWNNQTLHLKRMIDTKNKMLWVDIFHPQFFLKKIVIIVNSKKTKAIVKARLKMNDKVIKYGNRNYPSRFFVDFA